MHTTIDHLSPEKAQELKMRYYQGESVFQLMDKYDIHVLPATFYKLLPPDPVENYGCSRCEVNLVTDAVPRSKLGQQNDPLQYYCPVCGRKPFVEKSGWTVFPFLSKEERQQKRLSIAEYYDKNISPVEYDALSLTQKVYLAVLCKALLDKDNETILPLSGTNVTLAPTVELQEKIYTELLKNKIIVVDSDSQLDAFDIDSDSFPKKYDREKVSYKLNVIQSQTDRVAPIDIRNLLHIKHSGYDSEQEQLWYDIAVGECVVYLQYRLGKVGFNFNPGERTKEVFRKLLKNFSVSQIYYIIWCKVSDAARSYLEGSATKYRAASSVISACQRYGENAIYYARELPKYHRPSDCPQSVLTRFFYYEILKQGYQADNICIGQFTSFHNQER